jgi:hypothetical protein
VKKIGHALSVILPDPIYNTKKSLFINGGRDCCSKVGTYKRRNYK